MTNRDPNHTTEQYHAAIAAGAPVASAAPAIPTETGQGFSGVKVKDGQGTPMPIEVAAHYAYVAERIIDVFDKDATAGSFLREDGEGGFASGIHRMAREIDALRAYISDMPAVDGDVVSGCEMGVGCIEAGICYANAHGQPDRCGIPAPAIDIPAPAGGEEAVACPGYMPDYQAMGDCVNCGRMERDHVGDPFAHPVSASPSLQAEVERLRAERDHWKANHDEMVARNAVLRDRPDLPADRLPALARIEAETARLKRDLIIAEENDKVSREFMAGADKRVAQLEAALHRITREASSHWINEIAHAALAPQETVEAKS